MRTYHPLTRPRYYRDRAGDYLVVVGLWRDRAGRVRHAGAAAAMIGRPRSIMRWEFDPSHIRRCRPVPAEQVPPAWRTALAACVRATDILPDGEEVT